MAIILTRSVYSLLAFGFKRTTNLHYAKLKIYNDWPSDNKNQLSRLFDLQLTCVMWSPVSATMIHCGNCLLFKLKASPFLQRQRACVIRQTSKTHPHISHEAQASAQLWSAAVWAAEFFLDNDLKGHANENPVFRGNTRVDRGQV